MHLPRRTLPALFALLAMVLLPFSAPAHGAAKKKGGDDATVMHLHHMHTLMNHGLSMVLQGANMVMLSEMQMAPGVDPVTKRHGAQMIAEGKGVIKEVLSGSDMKKAHEEGRWNDPLMGYTHELGAAVLAVVDDAEKMDLSDLKSPAGMKMHHMHVALNHAMVMAAEGSNLVMLGRMKMAGKVDEKSIAHGRKMIADARLLWSEIMGGEAMKALHQAGATPEGSPQMVHTHTLARHGEKVLSLLEKMNALNY